ncbi:hypothetical protein K502DRAFT_348499 [Neoconidiobolus thromboides FSU 785]|nr:hypothetical protein K502DRAFT_348499 [Neoconidiobolus thromboides FSU 785]
MILFIITVSDGYTAGVEIRKTVRQELSQSTLLCIAHQLRSITGYDKVVVTGNRFCIYNGINTNKLLSHGIIKEFDSPDDLIKEGSLFRAMRKESGDYKTLE